MKTAYFGIEERRARRTNWIHLEEGNSSKIRTFTFSDFSVKMVAEQCIDFLGNTKLHTDCLEWIKKSDFRDWEVEEILVEFVRRTLVLLHIAC